MKYFPECCQSEYCAGQEAREEGETELQSGAESLPGGRVAVDQGVDIQVVKRLQQGEEAKDH